MRDGIKWQPRNLTEFVAAITFFGAGLFGLGIAWGCYRTANFFKGIRGNQNEH